MAGELKSSESQQSNEVSDMETVSRWVKATVKDYRSFIELSGQGVAVSRVMDGNYESMLDRRRSSE